jgi:hypothetical protein
LTRVGGFFGHHGDHWWTVTEDGWIIDPTYNQFRKGLGVIGPDDPRQALYDEVPPEYIHMLPSGSYTDHIRRSIWIKMKGMIRNNIPIHTERGEDIGEWRVAKNQQDYWYRQFRCVFSWDTEVRVRNILVFAQNRASKASHMILVNEQRRFIQGDKDCYPIKQRRIYVLRNGWWVERIKGKTVTLDRDTFWLVSWMVGATPFANDIPQLPRKADEFDDMIVPASWYDPDEDPF